MSKQTGEIRQDGLLYIDRDKAVQQNLEALKKMIRPGNVRAPALDIATKPLHSK